MSEDDLLRAVLQLAKLYGLRTAHFRPAQSPNGRWLTPVQGDGKGWPDLTIVGPGGLLFRELKTERGSTSPEQKVWLTALTEAGADVGVWKPRDLRSGAIDFQLRPLRARHVRDLIDARARDAVTVQPVTGVSGEPS